MDTLPPPPPPPPFSVITTPTPTSYTPIPQLYYNDTVSHHHHSSPPTPSIIIVMIIISSAIIISATIYLLIRFLTRRCNRSFSTFSPADDVVSNNRNDSNESNETEHVRHHVISITNNALDSLPLFTFSSLTGKIAGGDCAVCLSKFESSDQLRLLPLCCHAFHAQCIDAWLKSNMTCPLCRSTVNPNEEDIMNTLTSGNGGSRRAGGNRSNSFRIEIGTISQRRDPANSDRRSYSVGSYDYVLDDGYEIPVESTHRSVVSDCTSGDKDSTAEAPGESLAAEVAAGGSGRFNWLRDYVDRVSVSLRGSGRFFTGSSRRSEAVSDFDGGHGRIGEEISELFRWLSGV
ncbi:putative transcription factor C2H2 family [Helianthus annuus]|uniref:RING-type E3 ubiquitin transferase n=1 Tax=Helianthus annuus TaxID=4232 RepID=A0A251S5C1_HELAN|nr:E3 ubiquitin-protein ligase ATL4 [Helianthus annuus]KAF5761277.1 putative transcription factor C2H2 family [Helianthus annuus]KAJ0444168.1 putative transcription factor C2H2 family [Helianthus annuus]KAJ0461514.1 putative transcription factor C2H2 family [Helianthus annuus]KAJ0641937.1 putative transcription factor C2H2 family [Helianthus annuus]KAJ0645812.1 putative transcription factor C2H2 family [Helianthus annuus]